MGLTLSVSPPLQFMQRLLFGFKWWGLVKMYLTCWCETPLCYFRISDIFNHRSYLNTSNKFGIGWSTLTLLSNKSNKNNKQSQGGDVLPADHPANPWPLSCHEFDVICKPVDVNKKTCEKWRVVLNLPCNNPSLHKKFLME